MEVARTERRLVSGPIPEFPFQTGVSTWGIDGSYRTQISANRGMT
jgi:hypothetical protein